MHVTKNCRINVLFEWYLLKIMVFLVPGKGEETLKKFQENGQRKKIEK